jgi:hypothetical protein
MALAGGDCALPARRIGDPAALALLPRGDLGP